MNEGVLTVAEDGTIIYSNSRFVEILKMPLQKVIGSSIHGIISPTDGTAFETILEQSRRGKNKGEVSLAAGDETVVPVQLSLNPLEIEEVSAICIVAVDLTEQKRIEKSLRTALSEIKTMKDQLEAENIYFRQEIKMKHQFDHILGQSDGLKYVLYRAEQVAPTNTTVLILGETGTGKELIAAAIHDMSPRKDRPLITVNCAALPANLIESELFGRERGTFTGADTRQIGRFEVANGSTLCLDEIGELPLEHRQAAPGDPA